MFRGWLVAAQNGTQMTVTALTTTWRDPSRPPGERIDALLAEMTLAEKVAQLGSVWLGFDSASGDVAPMQNVFSRATTFAEATAHGLGQLTRVFGTAPVTAAQGVTRVHELQRALMSSTRLGIPAVVHEECLTGFTTYQATVYPGSLAWAATFDPALVHEMASAIGRDMAAVGVHQGLSPVLDVVRDYRWGRVEETLGEDPYLVSQIGSAYVRGLEENGIIATLKHFAGYAASQAARNHAPVSMGPREFADVILPPFEHAVRYAGVRSVMNSYTDVDGIPVASDEALLTGVLRDRWGFTGTVVSDYGAVAFLQIMHKIAETEGEAAAYALAAGLDVELPSTLCYGQPLLDEIAAGRVDEALVDRSVRRVLAQKIELGLLDPDWTPEATATPIEFDSAANRDIARRLAEESVVLLDNPSGVLPLAGDRELRVAVIGPCADDPQAFFGCYAFPNHVIPQHPEFAGGIGIAADSLLTALRAELPSAEISFLPGCEISGGDDSGIPAAAATAGDRRSGAAGRRRPRRSVRWRHLRGGLRRRGPGPAGTPAAAGGGGPGHRHTGGDDHGLRPPVRSRPLPRPAGRHRAGVLPRRGGRRCDRRGAVRSGEPHRQAAGRRAAPRRRLAVHLPGPAARSAQPGRQQPRPQPGVLVRSRALLHLVRVRRPGRRQCGDRRRRHRSS